MRKKIVWILNTSSAAWIFHTSPAWTPKTATLNLIQALCHRIANPTNTLPFVIYIYIHTISKMLRTSPRCSTVVPSLTPPTLLRVALLIDRTMIHSRPQLVHHVSVFVERWSGMATKLFCFQQVVPPTVADGKRYVTINFLYGLYQSHVSCFSCTFEWF